MIASRTILGRVPDRAGATRTLSIAVLAEATGLVSIALSSTLPVTISALVLLALGQGLAVPALGMRALSADHGASSGLFFGYFDLGAGSADRRWASSPSGPTRARP